MAKIKIHSRYDVPASQAVVFGPSMTQQHFKDECDINNIIRSYRAVEPPSGGVFGDFTVTDLQAAYELSDSVHERFMSLPSDIRQKFNNNPLELAAFVNNVDNQTAAIEMGLLPAESAEVPETTVPENIANNTPDVPSDVAGSD